MNPETLAALGEPNRFRIVELLLTGPRSVNDIRGRLGLRQSQVSQHLRVLKVVGLVEAEPRAQQRLYRLRAQPVKQLHKWLDRYRCIWEERFEELDELVEEIKQRRNRMLQARTVGTMRNETTVERSATVSWSSRACSMDRRILSSTHGPSRSS